MHEKKKKKKETGEKATTAEVDKFFSLCDVLKKRLNSMHSRAVKFIFPDTTLTTDQKLKEIRIMSLQKQLEYNKGLFMYRILSNGASEYISNLCTHTPSRYTNSKNYQK